MKFNVESHDGEFKTKNFTCARADCPCLSTWNAREDTFCCKTCKDGEPCATATHWTAFHGTILPAALAISQTGFWPTPAQTGELGEGIYATCVMPGTDKSEAEDAINREIGKAKRFAHDVDLRKNDGANVGPIHVPVLIICIITIRKVYVRPDGGSDPEGWDSDPVNGDKAKGRTITRASWWKTNGYEACYTTSTDGVRSPYMASKNSELCFESSTRVQEMRVIRLDDEGTCPYARIKPYICRYEEAGFTCPFKQKDARQAVIDKLLELGVSRDDAMDAARRCSSVEAAMEWLAANFRLSL